jgi:hypothetical protein
LLKNLNFFIFLNFNSFLRNNLNNVNYCKKLCKNLFYLFFFFEYFFNNKIFFSFKSIKKITISQIRSPNRYKTSQKNFFNKLFLINVTIFFKFKSIFLNNFYFLFFFKSYILNYFIFFESSLILLKKKKLFINCQQYIHF